MNIDQIQNIAQLHWETSGASEEKAARWATVYLLCQLVRAEQPWTSEPLTLHDTLNEALRNTADPHQSPLAENSRKVAEVIAQQQRTRISMGRQYLTRDGEAAVILEIKETADTQSGKVWYACRDYDDDWELRETDLYGNFEGSMKHPMDLIEVTDEFCGDCGRDNREVAE